MSKVIGVTGSIATGKSTVTKKLADLGFEVIDCDKISHEVLLKGHEAYDVVKNAFGKTILDENAEISRSSLGKIIFNNPEKRDLLNSIMHPIIYDVVKDKIAGCHDDFVILDCPLLFETNFKNLCDKTVVVYVDEDSQIHRLMNRDNIDFPTAVNKVHAQMSCSEKVSLADYVIDNCHSLYDLDWQIKQLLEKLKGEK